MKNTATSWIRIAPSLKEKLDQGAPLVALESTVITHGLPRPLNLELARQMEKQVLSAGAFPATVAMVEGEIQVGLSPEQLERIALDKDAVKISTRDIPMGVLRRMTGGTTVAATAWISHQAGIRIFATGGIGGVHHGETGDISADIPALAFTPVAVICSGAKSILDIPRSLERLETDAVPVVGWGTDQFPAFFSRESGLPVSIRIESSAEAATYLKTHWELGFKSAVVICVPCPEPDELPYDVVDEVLQQAEMEAVKEGVRGKDLTPYLLTRLAELTAGATLKANSALLRNNAQVAAEIAIEVARIHT